jgi:hypothetical protein
MGNFFNSQLRSVIINIKLELAPAESSSGWATYHSIGGFAPRPGP